MKILGVMSGTSLDGLDLAVCSFKLREKRWSWEIQDARTIPYPEPWIRKLDSAHSLSGMELQFLHQEYGQFIAMESGSFLASYDQEVEIIDKNSNN